MIEVKKKKESSSEKKKKNIKFDYFLDDEIKIKKTNFYDLEEYIEENMMNIKELKSKKLKIQNNNIYERIEGDITYLENGNVKFNEDIYLNTEIMKDDDEKEIYVKCGMVLRCDETTLYLVNGRLFEECEEDSENEDEIVQWGDGKYYKRFLLDSEKELEKRNLELKKRKLELKIELKKKQSLLKKVVYL